MLARFRAGVRLFLRLHPPDRTLQILPDDVFLVSFPKSGNTWTRFLIANLTHPETPANWANISRLIPDPEDTSKKIFDRMLRPRIIKSHECFDPRYPKVIYIVRDPRDVAVSQYHFLRKCRHIPDGHPMEQHINRFLTSEGSPYGSWGESVGTWLVARRNDPRFLLVRYEDLIDNTALELARIAGFLGITASEAQIQQAVERSSAENMRKLEKQQSLQSSMTKTSRQDLPFVRNAKKGSWREELPEFLVAKIEATWAPLMRCVGYELLTTVSDAKELDFVLNGIPG